MTDITYLDRRYAREWATAMEKYQTVHPSVRAAARVILATVEAPALSEELANITETLEEWATEAITTTLAVATDLAKQMEQELKEARAEVERLRATHPNVEGTRHGYDIRHTMRKPEPDHPTYTTPEGDVYRIYETADQLPDTDESFRDRYGALTDAEYEKENEVPGIRDWSDGPWVKVKGDENVDGWVDFVGFKYPIWGL